MSHIVTMRLNCSCSILPNRPDKGDVIQCVTDHSKSDGEPSRAEICKALRRLGFDAEENDAVCAWCNWDIMW